MYIYATNLGHYTSIKTLKAYVYIARMWQTFYFYVHCFNSCNSLLFSKYNGIQSLILKQRHFKSVQNNYKILIKRI